MAALTKAELIDRIATATDVSKKDTGAVLDALTSHLHRTLKKGTEVKLADIGKFSVSKRAARKGRNPATGEAIKIKARKVPKFKAAKALKDAVS